MHTDQQSFAPDLTQTERDMLWTVYSILQTTYCSPGTERLARATGKSKAQVSVILGGIIGKGYLQKREPPVRFIAQLTDKAFNAINSVKVLAEAKTPDPPRSPYYLPPDTPEADRVTVPLDQNTFGCLCAMQTAGESQDECIRRLIWEAWRRS